MASDSSAAKPPPASMPSQGEMPNMVNNSTVT
jgi:hypothetical protein